jgi:putative signal transducing protein
MKRLFTATNSIDGANIEMLKGLLEEAQIRCMIRNEYLSSAMGEVPFLESSPELWILNDEDYLRASALLQTWRTTRIEVHGPWACTHCGENIEGQFTSCWQCGEEREGARPVAES